MGKLEVFFKNFSKKEKVILKIALICFSLGVVILVFSFYFSSTSIQPAFGGKLIEGEVGGLDSLNPVLVSCQEPAFDLVELIYNGILKPDGKGGFKCDLCEKIEISPDYKRWKVYLRKNVFWHDGQPFDSEDVIFTIEKILDPKVNSPYYLNWQGVVVKCLDSYTLEFFLKNPYPFFKETLSLLKIIPKHIWENIEVANYYLSSYNLLPVGTGPFIVKNYQKTNEGKVIGFHLERNKHYFENPPYLKEIDFKFYKNFSTALQALYQGKIDSLGNFSPFDFQNNFYNKRKLVLKTPRFFVLFLNSEVNSIFKIEKVRKALFLATDKERIVKELGLSEENFSNVPFFEGMEGFFEEFKKNFFNLEEAKKILKEAGFKDLDHDGFLEKKLSQKDASQEKTIKLKFELAVPESEILFSLANLLKKMYQEIGVKVEIKTLKEKQLADEILQRNFEALVFGQMLSLRPDLFSFWHSSQIFEPGQNISLYEDETIDEILEKIRETTDFKEREKLYYDFQKAFLEKNPGIYLFWYPYFWVVPKKIKNLKIEKINFPFERFFQVHQWYEKTIRKRK